MPTCSVFCCKKKSGTSSFQKDGVTFHVFPKDPILRDIWKNFCNTRKTWIPAMTSVMCSEHFKTSDFQMMGNNKRRLIQTAKPTLIPHCICSSHPLLSDSTTLPLPKVLSESPTLEHAVSSNAISQTKTEAPLTPSKRKLLEKVDSQKKKIRRLQAKNLYLKKKVASLEEILWDLEAKSLIDKEEKMVLEKIGVEEKELFLRQIKKSETGKLSRVKYSPELRCFALTLNFYSPKAYKYVRKTFGSCLPNPRTLTKWYSQIDGKPGFTKEALTAIKLKADADANKKVYCTLVFDEMKIMSKIESHNDRQFGFVDYGFDLETDNSDEATDALVFLLVGINSPWKVPIGFFLVKGTNAKTKAQLVTKAFELVHETGIEIKALTCDGAKANLAMARELGCSLDPTKLNTTILDPTTGQQVYFFLDPSHMLKLIRNTFGDYKCFFDGDGNKIDWLYIETLHKMQDNELFFMANKLRLNHIYFKSKIMNVRLAAQLFSASIADALSFCEHELDLAEFHGSDATSKFILLINDVFDILDSRSCQNGYKKALNMENFQKSFQRLEEARRVLIDLFAFVKKRNCEPRRMKLLDSPRYTGFLGFLIDIESTKLIFQDLVQNTQFGLKYMPLHSYTGFLGFLIDIESTKLIFQDLVQNTQFGLKYMPLHRVSQDHIELFFSNVRSHGGYSDNPTAYQFEAIYKKLLVNTELVQTSDGTNCVALEKISILNCTSAIQKINMSSVREYISNDFDEANFKNVIDDLIDDIEMQTFLTPFGEKILEYISGFVVFSITKKLKCNTCIKGLYGPIDEKSLICKKSKGRLVHASMEVINLCRFCEKEIRRRLSELNRPTRFCTTHQIVPHVMKNFIGKGLFSYIDYHSFENDFTNHNLELARLVMEKYTDTRISFLMKKPNPQKCIRQIYTKLIHFKNQ